MIISGSCTCLNEEYQPDNEFMPADEYADLGEFIECSLSVLDDFPQEIACSAVAKKLREGDFVFEEVEPGYFEVHVEYYQ